MRSDPAGQPRAFGGPCCQALMRQVPEDFQVDELPLVVPDGQGEHQMLEVRKRNANSDWVAGQLARHAGVPRRDVGYAGLKDRRAVTRQWFSVRLAGRTPPDWPALNDEQLEILQVQRHSRKLRTGALRGNRFRLVLRQLEGDLAGLEARLGVIARRGIPNYFGVQRFGHDGNNLRRAEALFDGSLRRVKRQQRSLYLSAARSLLFNQVLAQRVERGDWERPLPGERLMLDGSRNSFLPEQLDAEIEQRLAAMDIHPSGPLWGSGEPGVVGEAAAFEAAVLSGQALFRQGLERAGLEQARRALRAPVRELQWQCHADRLEMAFTLPRGSYATTLLAELASCREPEWQAR